MQRSLYAVVAFLCIAAPAWAGSMTFGASSGAACPATTAGLRCVNLTDAETARVLAWAKAAFGQVCDPTCRDRTNVEALDATSTDIFRAVRDKVHAYERDLARRPVDAAVAPIGVQ